MQKIEDGDKNTGSVFQKPESSEKLNLIYISDRSVYFRLVNKDDYFELGYISRLHGVKGAFVIQMDTDHPERYRNLKEIWVMKDDSAGCFRVEEISVRNNEAIVKLQGVNTVDAASDFIRKTVYLPLDMLPQLTGKQFYFHEIKDFFIKDITYGELGKIESVYNLPQHPVAGIMLNGKEILIPLVSDFIETLDRENKTIRTQLPEGMIEVYTNKTEKDDD